MSKVFLTGLFGSAGGGKPEEEKVVALDMADGDQIVTPTAGTTMSKVTVTKPSTLVPENIKMNAIIGGVTGSYAGQRTGGEFVVQAKDIDGTVLDYAELNAGDTFTLPTPPDRTAEGLIFQKWVSVFDIVDNTVTVTDDNIVIGPVYRAASGYTEILVDIPSDNFAITLNLNKSGAGAMAVDWGDSFSSSTAAAGAVSLEHAFFTTGKYTIKIMTEYNYALGSGAASGNTMYLLGSGVLNKNIVKVYVGNQVTALNANCLASSSVSEISLSDSILSLGNASLNNMWVQSIIIPDSVTSIGDNVCTGNSLIKSVVMSKNITAIGSSAFSNCHRLEHINIPNVKIIKSGCFTNCVSLNRIVVPETVTELELGAFQNTYFKTFKCRGKNISTLGASTVGVFSNCIGDSLDVSNIITPNIPNRFLENHSLRRLVMFRFTNSIQSTYFTVQQPFKLLEIDISRNTTVPTLSTAGYFPASTGARTKIYVRQSLLEAYKTATNWSAFATLYVGVPDDEIDD